ncbi:antibiotic biosynthesis monooxygenase [Beijerinckia sp. L45]|uniref:antibiotic biosynthesis monooxygenase family protein n=1 Tax=Beijerinckia sp. L45 TaxID=1641855 RepID=UPI00131BEFE9|nr:antibiotic biosynthesis monooxygenase [Beijerinckia sp. L45]
MARIAEDATFTQIVRFDVEPKTQDDLIAAIVAEVERWVRHRPGFISSTFHASLDGRHVLNYAQWADEASFKGFTQDPEGERVNRRRIVARRNTVIASPPPALI